MDTAKLVVGNDGKAIMIKDDVNSKWKEELSKPLNLSETKKKVIPKLHLLAKGMIPLEGYSLITTFNHYNIQSEEKEDLIALRDAMWYNAGHPVNVSFKKESACSNTVKHLLVEAGLGSVAAKLPYIEPEVRKAKSYITVLETVSPIIKRVGRPIEVVTVNNPPIHLRSLDSRENVLNSIKHWCTRNAGNVAFCFGFYMAMVENGDQFEGARNLETSYSLKALKETYIGSYCVET
ncbi:uncharacterized protein LOC17886254 [Capsella rubella]|uniref:uncharacterized protein LOC17886254 n=1 Tax=Capsella rubella TaxID=81985 RepID=UPI000CD53E20|nr:uncharacterized protein LOC17886254 [Capsella rubella]